MEKIIVIGAGPAGLTAAIYLARDGFSPLVIAGLKPGGQPMETTIVENYPGFAEGILGQELMQNMIKQAERFGARLVYEDAVGVNFRQGSPFTVSTRTKKYQAEAIIVATGTVHRKLGLPSEEKFWGKGVSVCATCDGPLYKDKRVAVVGGGDTAMEEASFLTHFAKQVFLIHRRDTFRASKSTSDKVIANPKIEILKNSEVKEILGDNRVSQIKVVNNQTGKEIFIEIDGLFLAVGHLPATEIFAGQLEMDENGYLVRKNGTQSSLPGVFVAGDVADPCYRQIVVAAGEGCKAAIEARKYLEEKSIL